nr:PREDICTED: uncharacterized protein LOC106707119 [Latimeria chalumnae]|eukprot:XP_014354451.1 PREDICTED: uncharacterized protein LOC106707119 [Latimeria chalumnae]
MNLAPHLNYISAMLPIYIPSRDFLRFQDTIKKILWDGRRPRISDKKLYPHVKLGGLGLLNLHQYSLAYHAMQIAFWLWPSKDDPDWVDLEKLAYTGPLPALLSLALPRELVDHPMMAASHRIWRELARKCNFLPEVHSYVYLWGNPRLKVGGSPLRWMDWEDRGLLFVKDLMDKGVICTSGQLKNRFHLPQSHFWRYLQIRSALMAALKSLGERTVYPELLRHLETGRHQGHAASIVYRYLATPPEALLQPLRSKCRRNWVKR